MTGTQPRRIRVVAAVIQRDGSYLITQRRPSAVLPLLWEFPGGRVEANETDKAALVREVRHRLDVELDVLRLISFISHPYERYVVDLHLYECQIASGQLRNQNVNSHAWVASHEFEKYLFTPADEASVAALLGLEPTP
jgi:8-oxo-dGTP diphosphatase